MIHGLKKVSSHLTGTIIRTVVCTVMLCVLAHGLTANPWAKGIARRLKSD